MVLNTGRTASRAFYLNLKRQRSVLSVSRTYLDAAISRFMSKGDSSSLVRVEGILKALRGHACGNTAFGTVFHGVRPLLAYPFSDERNREVLKALRDRWGIRTVFFPIRDPRDLFLSSLNRSLAHAAGDWRFPPDVFGWKNQFSFDELSNGAATGSEDRSSPKGDPGLLHKIAVHISERTGRLHSLYELFSAVFDEIYLVDYRKLLEDPEAIYRGIAEVGGFSFDDTTLAQTTLNGLANRLLLYNPINVRVFGKPLRFRIELSSAIHLCDDWGSFHPVEYDCSRHLAPVEDDLGAEVSVGLSVTDKLSLSELERQIVERPDFIEELLGRLLPVFLVNYTRTKDFYENEVYFNQAPDDLYALFWKEAKSEHERMFELIEKKKVAFI